MKVMHFCQCPHFGKRLKYDNIFNRKRRHKKMCQNKKVFATNGLTDRRLDGRTKRIIETNLAFNKKKNKEYGWVKDKWND